MQLRSDGHLYWKLGLTAAIAALILAACSSDVRSHGASVHLTDATDQGDESPFVGAELDAHR